MLAESRYALGISVLFSHTHIRTHIHATTTTTHKLKTIEKDAVMLADAVSAL